MTEAKTPPGQPSTTGAVEKAAAPTSIAALEAEVAARRERLAATIDELTRKATPKAIFQRQTEAAKARFADVATTPQGELRVERVAAVVITVVVIGGLVIYRRVHRA
ncbi:MAG: DUF3618 domain-containing protein [Ornithinibacter sp.]